MNSTRVLIGVVVIALLLYLLYYLSFEKVTVPDVKWNVDYFYENKEPNGGWLIKEILEDVYTEDRVVKLELENKIPLSDEESRKGYFIIDSYIGFEQNRIQQISNFVARGNDAIIIASDFGYYLDSLVRPYLNSYAFTDSIIHLSHTYSEKKYELVYYYMQFDSATTTTFNGFDSLNVDSFALQILSYANDTIPVFVKIPYDKGSLYLHSLPDAFSNIGIKQNGMSDYAISTLPLLNIDTLYLDHSKYNVFSSYNQSPLQFILSQPGLKWAYYTIIFSLIGFVISRAKRKQRVIPILEKNENTSLDYIYTLSELYRSQNQHYKLAQHLQTGFYQWVRKKYYIRPEQSDFVTKLANKSKVPKEEIESLINRLESAIDNQRFGVDRLTALYKDLDLFYKNSK